MLVVVIVGDGTLVEVEGGPVFVDFDLSERVGNPGKLFRSKVSLERALFCPARLRTGIGP